VPRPRRSFSGLRLSPSQAQQVLESMVNDGRISSTDLSRYFEIQQLEERLNALRGGGMQPGRRAGWRAAAAPAAGGRRRRGGPLTAQQRASRVLQGRYLGLIRQIPASQRGRYKKIVEDQGREAAIKAMQSVLKK